MKLWSFSSIPTKKEIDSYYKAQKLEPSYQVNMKDGSAFEDFIQKITKNC